jgi:hypothetical protein
MLCCSSDSVGSEVLPVWRRNAINKKKCNFELDGINNLPCCQNFKNTAGYVPSLKRGKALKL